MKRDLHKRPIQWKQTIEHEKRPTNIKKDLQKRPVNVKRNLRKEPICMKRDLNT